MSGREQGVQDRPRALDLIGTLVRYHPVLFATSMAGAATFAVCTVASSWAVRWMIDHAIIPRFDDGSTRTSTVMTAAGVLVLIAVIRACGVILRRTWAGKTQWRTAESLTGEVVDVLTSQASQWHRRQRAGDLITRAGVDVEAAVAILAPLPYASSVVLMLAVAGTGLILMDAVLGLVAVAVFPLLVVANVVYQRRVDHWFALAQAELGTLSSAVLESFEGITVVKAFGAESSEARRLAVIAGRVRAARVRAISLRSTFEAALDLLPGMTNIGLVLFGSYRVNEGHLTIGGLASFIYLFSLLVFPLRLVGYAFSELPRSQAGFARIRSVIGGPIVSDPRSSIIEPHFKGEQRVCVSLQSVSARHMSRIDESSDGDTVLHDITFDVAEGTMSVVVGSTGSGKTTLLEVIAGVLPVSSGRVAAPTDATTMVFQEPFLFAASIAENLTMGGAFDIESLRWALKVADAEFVFDLPNGLDTIVGERGVSLSGGQRQRIALARAVVRRPRLLLLDDTTSALDPVTEQRVISNVKRELPATTIVTVASRPNLIRLADDVIYLVDGGVAARGTHRQLLMNSSGYQQLLSAFERDRDGSDV